MKLFSIERPSALPAALLRVVAVPTAHVAAVGQSAVRTVATAGIPQLQVRTRLVGSVAVAGNAGVGIDRGKYAAKRASGVPPRGRPV